MRTFVLIFALLLSGMPAVRAEDTASTPQPAPEPVRPNIVILLADNLGYGDLGAQGGTDIPTPRIDSLAYKGVRFTSGYAAAPLGDPALAGLMTGRYPQRFGFEMDLPNRRNAPHPEGLPLAESTIADRLKTLGYKTAWIGGWPFGSGTNYHPLARGFDEFYGFFPEGRPAIPKREARTSASLMRGQTPVEENAPLTEAFAREASDFIARQKDRPFFLCVHFNTLNALPRVVGDAGAQFPNIQKKRRQAYAAMLASLDDNVGRVLDKLTALDLDTRTLVVFLGDCGGGGRMNASENAPLRGVRGQMFEGGIRVPFFARWSDFIPAGKSCNQPVTALDLLPTAVAVAGAEVSPDWKLDGASLLPLLTGTGNAPLHQSLCWRCGVESAIRAGDWKLVRLPRSGPKLFNLSEDIAEHTDLSGQEIGTARKLGVALDEWAATLADPLWTNGRQAKAAKSAAEGKRPHAPKKKPAGAGRDESQPVTSVQPSQGI